MNLKCYCGKEGYKYYKYGALCKEHFEERKDVIPREKKEE